MSQRTRNTVDMETPGAPDLFRPVRYLSLTRGDGKPLLAEVSLFVVMESDYSTET